MSVRANWHTPSVLVEDEEDPFGPTRVEVVGVPIALDGENAHLTAQVLELVRREGELDARGVTCAIRDRPDTCCSACPVARRDPRVAALCDVGLGQERALTTLAAIHDGG